MPRSRNNSVRSKEQRRHLRQDASGVLRILWEDSRGEERISYATLVNTSPVGVQLQVREQIPIRAPVTCNDVLLGIVGRGSVRYCNSNARGYEIGVEFSAGINGISA